MRDPARIKIILSLLENYWQKNPDLRLCQIVGNIARVETDCKYCLGKGWVGHGDMCIRCVGSGTITHDNYHVEDDEIIKQLEKLNEVSVG